MKQEPLSPSLASLSPRYIRLTAYLCAAAILAVGVITDHFPWHTLWMVTTLVLYPIFSNLFLEQVFRTSNSASRLLLVITDAMACGLIIAATDFDITLAVALLALTSCAVMISNGMQLWLVAIVSVILGALLSHLLLQGQSIKANDNGLVQWFAIGATACVCAFVAMLGHFSHKQAATLLSTRRELNQQKEKSAALSRKLAKYLPPQVWGSMFTGRRDRRLETQRRKLTVFFSDICRFSEISEELQPEALTDLLNSYFTEMSRIASKHGGTIDKFVGDAMLVFFGDPNSHGEKEDAMACVSMAIEMRKRMKMLSTQWRRLGIHDQIEIRMGINTGYCTIGNFGADTRMDYTIIGKEVNLASRLESQAQPNAILLSEQTHLMVRDNVVCRDIGEISVKGFNKPVLIYEVVDFRKELGAAHSFIEYDLSGFSLYVDIDKIKNYDKERVLKALEEARRQVQDKLIV